MYIQSTGVDPAESLVFWLDGFSSDGKRPFTGRGGPFLAGSPPQPNPDRETGKHAFDRARFDYTDDGDFSPSSRRNAGMPPSSILTRAATALFREHHSHLPTPSIPRRTMVLRCPTNRTGPMDPSMP